MIDFDRLLEIYDRLGSVFNLARAKEIDSVVEECASKLAECIESIARELECIGLDSDTAKLIASLPIAYKLSRVLDVNALASAVGMLPYVLKLLHSVSEGGKDEYC